MRGYLVKKLVLFILYVVFSMFFAVAEEVPRSSAISLLAIDHKKHHAVIKLGQSHPITIKVGDSFDVDKKYHVISIRRNDILLESRSDTSKKSLIALTLQTQQDHSRMVEMAVSPPSQPALFEPFVTSIPLDVLEK